MELFATDVFCHVQSHVTQKLGQILKKSGPVKFNYCALV